MYYVDNYVIMSKASRYVALIFLYRNENVY